MSDKPKAGEVIPFGKHKGTPIDVLKETDPKYLEWLSEQDWFRQKYANFYQVIVNHGGEPAETPEHNALQLKFLDLDFKRAAWMLASDGDTVPSQIHAAFEEDGIDVLFAADQLHAAIELKPVMGDDYPAVVRQVRSYKQITKRRYGDPDPFLAVVVGSFQSQVATLDQIGEMFKDVAFLTVSQIEDFKRFVPEGIAKQQLLEAIGRHAGLEHLARHLDQNNHCHSLDGVHPSISAQDFRAIADAVNECGAQPAGIPEYREWRALRRAALERAVAEQTVLAHGAMSKAHEAVQAMVGKP